MNNTDYIIRASALGELMTSQKIKGSSRLTETQNNNYNKILLKIEEGKVTLTDHKNLKSFEEKMNRDIPLTETAKSMLFKVWLKAKKGFEEEVSSKHMQKGIEAEDDSITLLCDVREQFLIKNEEKRQKGLLAGTPDIVTDDKIIDLKTSWTPYTFMKAGITDLYEWQLRAYMYLFDKPEAELVYALVDLPEDLYNDELRKYCWAKGIIDTEHAQYDQQLRKHYWNFHYEKNEAYSKEERIKTFKIYRCDKLEKLMLETLENGFKFLEGLTLNYYPQS